MQPTNPTHSITAGSLSPAETYLHPKQLAKLLNLSARTVEAWRYRGNGPQYIRISARCIRYRLSDIMEWQSTLLQQNTSMNGGR